MLGFARHLPAEGWQVTVLYGTGNPREPLDSTLAARVPAQTEAIAVRYPRFGRFSAARWQCLLNPRRDLDTMWATRAMTALRRAWQAAPFDAVLTSGPPHQVHSLGVYAKRTWGLPWVADFRDPWHTKGLAKARVDQLLALEAVVWREADLLLANTPGHLAHMKHTHPDLAERAVCVPNGFDPEDYQGICPSVPRPEGLTLCHAGELYAGRDARPLLDALSATRSLGLPHGPATLVLIGRPTDYTRALQAAAQDMGLSAQLVHRGHVPFDQCRAWLRSADILILLDSAARTFGVPAKLYEYLGARRPVLALAEPEGEVAGMLAEAGAVHRLVAPGDGAGAARALADLVDSLGENPSNQPLDSRFTRQHGVNILARRLRRLVGGALQDGEEDRHTTPCES